MPEGGGRPRPGIDDLKRAHEKARRIHRTHLAAAQVEMPRWETVAGMHLAVLIHFEGEWVHKNEVSDIVRSINEKAAPDQQVRHLKRKGWNLESDGVGGHRIKSPHNPHPEHAMRRLQQSEVLSADDFERLKEAHGRRCLTCGALEGEPDPRYRDMKVRLQKGHMDPAKPGGAGNTIPQCQFCNRAYRDDFVFDEKGRARAVASPRPVLRASAEVRKAVLKALSRPRKGGGRPGGS